MLLLLLQYNDGRVFCSTRGRGEEVYHRTALYFITPSRDDLGPEGKSQTCLVSDVLLLVVTLRPVTLLCLPTACVQFRFRARHPFPFVPHSLTGILLSHARTLLGALTARPFDIVMHFSSLPHLIARRIRKSYNISLSVTGLLYAGRCCFNFLYIYVTSLYMVSVLLACSYQWRKVTKIVSLPLSSVLVAFGTHR